MRVIFFLICFLHGCHSFAGFPPTTLKGQNSSTTLTTFNYQVPAQQATKINSNSSLIETASFNLLSNPGFEHQTFSTSWTVSNATSAVETSNILADGGKQSASMSVSAQAGTITQELTPTGQTSGANLEASCFVKTSLATVSVCNMSGGSEGTCTTVSSANTWSKYSVNFTASSGTSIGVRVKTSSTTGTFYVDKCFVGPTFYGAPNVNTSSASSYGIETVQFYTTTWGTVCSGSPCTITTSMSGASVTRAGSGDYTLSIPGGTFSDRPTCVIMPGNTTNTIMPFLTSTAQTSTSFPFKVNDSGAGGAKDAFGFIICVGPR